MKKWISLFLVLAMLAALPACASNKNDAPANEPTVEETPAETPAAGAPIDAIALDDILSLFEDMSDGALSGLMHKSLTTEDAGYEMGYVDFAGEFEEAMSLSPMMNINPFVLAIFRLAEGADAEAFAADLEANANPGKWVCVQADKVFTEVSGRTVLFVMCSDDMVQPITDMFTEMTQEGFNPEEHMVNPLAGKTAQELYDELYELFAVDQYGFMDNEELSELKADSAYGLSNLELTDVAESIVDDGFAAQNETEPDRAYLLTILRLNDGADAEAIAKNIQETLDTSAMEGGEVSSMVAYGKGFVIAFSGTGTYGISATALETYLPMTYRMMAFGF